jgi:hypothetical protein
VDLKIDDGTSSYHGLRLGLARRASSGFSFQGSYTWSHSINDGSIGGGEANAPENASCVPCDRGPSVFDVRHGVEFSSYYELPFGMGKKYATEGVAGKVFGGWTLSDSWNWHTGHPITVLFGPGAGFLPDGNDSADQRPDIAPGVSLTPPGGSTAALWFNPLAFVPPPINPATGIFTRWGNAGRGLVRSPHIWQVDLALAKETKITERFGLEFGVQAFNIFNHTQLGDPSKTTFDYNPPPLNSSQPGSLSPPTNFGVISTNVNFNNNNDNKFSDNIGTGLARQLQLFVRLKF